MAVITPDVDFVGDPDSSIYSKNVLGYKSSATTNTAYPGLNRVGGFTYVDPPSTSWFPAGKWEKNGHLNYWQDIMAINGDINQTSAQFFHLRLGFLWVFPTYQASKKTGLGNTNFWVWLSQKTFTHPDFTVYGGSLGWVYWYKEGIAPFGNAGPNNDTHQIFDNNYISTASQNLITGNGSYSYQQEGIFIYVARTASYYALVMNSNYQIFISNDFSSTQATYYA